MCSFVVVTIGDGLVISLRECATDLYRTWGGRVNLYEPMTPTQQVLSTTWTLRGRPTTLSTMASALQITNVSEQLLHKTLYHAMKES